MVRGGGSEGSSEGWRRDEGVRGWVSEVRGTGKDCWDMISVNTSPFPPQITGGTKAEDTEEFKEAVRVVHEQLQNQYDEK